MKKGRNKQSSFATWKTHNYINKTIYKLNSNWEIITSPRDILTEQKKIYKHIYSSSVPYPETNNQIFLENDGCVKPLTDDEN